MDGNFRLSGTEKHHVTEKSKVEEKSRMFRLYHEIDGLIQGLNSTHYKPGELVGGPFYGALATVK